MSTVLDRPLEVEKVFVEKDETTLAEIRRVLDERGWGKGQLWDDDFGVHPSERRNFCLVGAAIQCVTEDNVCLGALEEIAEETFGVWHSVVTMWNDKAYRTKDQVIDLLARMEAGETFGVAAWHIDIEALEEGTA